MKQSISLDARMKMYEDIECRRTLMPGLPIYARIDGRCFSQFTRDMERPFDLRMSEAMTEVTRYLVEETQARIGYTQSDEISLVWSASDSEKPLFSGRLQKYVSVLAGMATAKFMQVISDKFPSEYLLRLPAFDCRVFNTPSETECANMILWRQMDATKNAVGMAARVYYSNEQLSKKSGKEVQEMLFRQGINFNDYPAFFKRGVFVRLNHLVDGAKSSTIDLPPLTKVTNRIGVIFSGEAPVLIAGSSNTQS